MDYRQHIQLAQGTGLACHVCKSVGVVAKDWVSREPVEIPALDWKDYLLPDDWSVSVHADKDGIPDGNVCYCPDHKKTLYAVAYELATGKTTFKTAIDYTQARTPLEAAQIVALPFKAEDFKLVSSAKVIGLFGRDDGKGRLSV